MKEFIDTGSLIVVMITFLLFTIALFVKGFTHDLLLEAGVFLVSVKLIIMSYQNTVWGGYGPVFQRLMRALLSANENMRWDIIAAYPITLSSLFQNFIVHSKNYMVRLFQVRPHPYAQQILNQFDVVAQSIQDFRKQQSETQRSQPPQYQQQQHGSTYESPELPPYVPSTSGDDYSIDPFEEDSRGWPGGAYQNPDSSYYTPDYYDDYKDDH